MDPTRSALERAAHHAFAFLDRLGEIPVSSRVDYRALKARLGRPLEDKGVDPVTVIDDLVADAESGLTVGASGRFFAWVIGGTLPSALAADWLTSAWDQNAAMYAVSPASAVVEEVAGEWLKELLGLPKQASFAFVTGCQMAHFTCVIAARNALLARNDWDVEKRGLYGATPIRVLTNDQYHGSFELAVRYAGLGTDAIVNVESDADGTISAQALERVLRADDKPTILHLQAGDINTGAYDAFDELIPLAHRYHAWVHVDGAFGLWCNASPRYKHLLHGVEHADSWATDGHKWLNVPYDCGYAFVARPQPHQDSQRIHAGYLTHAQQARDQLNWNPEWSRRARGFATYAAIRELGRDGIRQMIERCNALAHDLVTRLGELPHAEMLVEPIINQGLVRFLDPAGTAHDHDRFTDDVVRDVTSEGEAFFSGTTWGGMRCMRVSVVNWRTTQDDVQRAVDAVARRLALVDAS